MSFNAQNIENHLLESAAGQAVYDSLVQANVNLQTVSIELVKQMLIAEYKYRRTVDYVNSSMPMAVC
ncbi:MAG: hypothetical protein GY758_03925 [Fuerstiella sp.]|nr:hypothetical protein [Fuerstiella sp.]MCP4507543.1 hypothetical protein [Fuerstiella sp.]